jgi:hypothetical protein
LEQAPWFNNVFVKIFPIISIVVHVVVHVKPEKMRRQIFFQVILMTMDYNVIKFKH